jgi:hypothetical protein
MTKYYFVNILLPELQLEETPEMTFETFDLLLQDNLDSLDYRLTCVIRKYYDLENLRAYWKNETLDSYGNLDKEALKETLFQSDQSPQYVQDFLEEYETQEERLIYFPKLIAAYFREEGFRSKGFLKKYLQFERKIRFIQAAFRARHLNRKLTLELQFEDLEEDFIRQLLSQNEAVTFEPPEGFEELKSIFEQHYGSPIDLLKAFSEYRLQQIKLLAGEDAFSMDRILAYMAQLMIVEQWQKMKETKNDASN